MASKRREKLRLSHPDCSCTSGDGAPKNAYPDSLAAVTAASHLAHAKGFARIYRCPSSPTFHVTSQPKAPPRPAVAILEEP